MSKCTPEAQMLVKQLLADPENAVCADCQKNVSKWASSTLGIFICYECSGIHRSLGTHISFVRSVTLDGWTPEQARVMKRVGNRVANEYWLHNLPADFSIPSPYDRFGMENFIRQKYVERRWADSCEPPQNRKGRFATPSNQQMQSPYMQPAPVVSQPNPTPTEIPKPNPIKPVTKPKISKSPEVKPPEIQNTEASSSFDFINEMNEQRQPQVIVQHSSSRRIKGMARWAKKPSGDAVINQMMTGGDFRPMSAPVNLSQPGSAVNLFAGLDFSQANH
ncbi:ARF GAP-like zinc finger-containing protein [Trichomonas vaginalis G3]|uniref:ARF GAP-like zinc finger-containing protein n=1 Tax=Trichomonas vaginalis (strain ATCC PRA-98 / G3) TaxID=412133 RepID=A2DP09_TRIV3|nr:GTPase activator protein [Trichomonas vaginalis G3]EAY17858.1 ARF GAP-like zinc finger-containing protein [Trichomonas vaginalis G3]KAI5489942.1 GTPase activator protein [Trichomonas vaginalis G3]|eukprot:XP_001329993.1 ARF GAP-like zinc finger-containing protein [Trichomonas vaginalis G3]